MPCSSSLFARRLGKHSEVYGRALVRALTHEVKIVIRYLDSKYGFHVPTQEFHIIGLKALSEPIARLGNDDSEFYLITDLNH